MMRYLECPMFTFVWNWNLGVLKLNLEPVSKKTLPTKLWAYGCQLRWCALPRMWTSEYLLRFNEPLPSRHCLKTLRRWLQSALHALSFIRTAVISKSSCDIKNGFHSSELWGGLNFLLWPSERSCVLEVRPLLGWYIIVNLWASGLPEGPAICATGGGEGLKLCAKQMITLTVQEIKVKIKHTRCTKFQVKIH